MTTEKVHFLYKPKSASPIMQIGPKIILQPRIVFCSFDFFYLVGYKQAKCSN